MLSTIRLKGKIKLPTIEQKSKYEIEYTRDEQEVGFRNSTLNLLLGKAQQVSPSQDVS